MVNILPNCIHSIYDEKLGIPHDLFSLVSHFLFFLRGDLYDSFSEKKDTRNRNMNMSINMNAVQKLEELYDFVSAHIENYNSNKPLEPSGRHVGLSPDQIYLALAAANRYSLDDGFPEIAENQPSPSKRNLHDSIRTTQLKRFKLWALCRFRGTDIPQFIGPHQDIRDFDPI